VGICSTTYGDLVCRGCKRYSHEIVQWNAFAEEQRGLVWERLLELREGAVLAELAIDDAQTLGERAEALRIQDAAGFSAGNLAYEVLRRTARRLSTLAEIGLSSRSGRAPLAALEAIDSDFYQRSLARYERDFRTLAT
jgi:predicted Fe-S protein YdhL (DUF1289 family)